MANKRNAQKGDTSRDGGGFVALPWQVLDCPAYADLSHPAKALLLEFARQFVRDNNGRLLASLAHLKPRGWRSADVITRAKKELLEAGFVHETVKGHRPNKAGWHAVTWRSLDRIKGYDVGAAETFERGAYRKNAPIRPSRGTGGATIAPSPGVEGQIVAPSPGAIRPACSPPPAPSPGNHLDMPSPGVVEPASNSMAKDGEPQSERPTDTDTTTGLWAAVGCRSTWTTPNKAERLRRARDAEQRAVDRHRPKPATSVIAGAVHIHHGDDVTRVRDEHAHDLSAWAD